MPNAERGSGEIQSSRSPALIRLLRPHQWSKNLLVFAAAVFANELFVPQSASLAAFAFVAFCLASSSVYVINDILDVEVDRQHPVKRARPVAAGEIGVAAASWLAAALAIAALGLALTINGPFAVAIAVYITLVFFYSIVGKHIVIFDVMLVAVGFVLRAVGGALAIRVPSSDWFVLCTFFAALFLALSKRRAEMISQDGGSTGHRSVIGEYNESGLATYTATAIAATVITYSLYAIDAAQLFPLLPLTVPFVLFAVFRYHHLVETAGFGERPEEVFLRDRTFKVCVLAFLALSMAAIYLEL
ncbi:MAG: decaprenyl-phosphate phosphoribosyltransferase [Deltaproteobacteria bacterium]|jgi:4-hydroxybenzoate polyprenyltransferase|nr:decaprenyl-phosphate phosphoribosyltransferase [Deltaproteobacteria bacterium]MBW2540721.1 decaprenyl-phosphate phosphoribosyltransferase [Deltaproteobacteria bacterium]